MSAPHYFHCRRCSSVQVINGEATCQDCVRKALAALNAKLDETHTHRCFNCEKTVTAETADRQALQARVKALEEAILQAQDEIDVDSPAQGTLSRALLGAPAPGMVPLSNFHVDGCEFDGGTMRWTCPPHCPSARPKPTDASKLAFGVFRPDLHGVCIGHHNQGFRVCMCDPVAPSGA